MNDIYLNTILYGVAGTGKTYNTIIYSVAIVENKSIEEISKQPYENILERFNNYKNQNLIEFITFHQSYSYEEFVEGIKPTLNTTDISYKLQNGIFKKFCRNYSSIDFIIGKDVSSSNAKHYKYIVDSISNENINIKKFKLGTGQDGKILTIPLQLILDLVQSVKNNSITIMDLKNSNFEISFKYDTSIIKYYKDILANIVEIILLNKVDYFQNRVFIIDEINRGNISSIFGELITLIEPSKRLGNLEQTKIKLSYSNEYFGVPNNVYILGTMNSTDHSAITLDIALRRRFHFVELLPNYDIFKGVSLETIDICSMLKNINLRIEYLLGKDYLIGHTYFLEILDFPSIQTLAKIFKYTVIPLLEEYFHNDYEKIRLVLADDKTNIIDNQFIFEKTVPSELFSTTEIEFNPIYVINDKSFYNIGSYLKI